MCGDKPRPTPLLLLLPDYPRESHDQQQASRAVYKSESVGARARADDVRAGGQQMEQ